MRRWVSVLMVAAAVAGVVLPAAPTGAQAITLNGAGASFPFPLYSKWAQVYAGEKGVQINYQSVGSGAGIRAFMAGTVDFAGTDAPMTDEQIRQTGRRVLHIPTVAGSVAVIYSAQGVGIGLNLTGDLLAEIYQGRITKWSDGRIARLNPGVALPPADIVVVRRSDSSGTTAIFTNYLSGVSARWKATVGEGPSVNWPTGLGGRGNEGVAGLVRQTPNSIGYVELAYAMLNRLPFASLQNRQGQFVRPGLSAVTRAVDGAVAAIPEDFRVFFTNPEGRDVYPIVGFTWVLVYGDQPDSVKGKALVDFLRWATRDGQRYAAPLLYAPLPKNLAQRVEQALRSITSGGKPLL